MSRSVNVSAISDRVGMAAQLVQLLGANPAAVGQQHPGRHAVEQAGRKCDGTDAGQLGGLLAHALQAGLAGAGAQGHQGRRRALFAAGHLARIGRVQQGFQSRHGLGWQLCEQGGAERILVPVQDGAHQPLQPFRRGRFHALVPAPFACRRQQPVRAAFKREHLALQPAAERLGVVQRGFAEAERRADLGAVVFDGPAAPVVGLLGSGPHADLASDCLDSGKGHVFWATWEAALRCE